MKCLFLLIALAVSIPAFANPLSDTWSNCDVETDGNELDHYITFGKNNVMFEAYMFTKPSKTPCGGAYVMSIGMYWHYATAGKFLNQTSFSSYLIIHDPGLIKKANTGKLCGKSNWKLEEKIDCSDDKHLKSELGRGRKAMLEYSLVGGELHLVEEGKVIIYKKVD